MQCLALQALPWTFVLPLEGHPGGGDIQAMSYYHPLWQRTEPERGCAIPSLSEEGMFSLVLRTYPGRLARLSEVCPSLGLPSFRKATLEGWLGWFALVLRTYPGRLARLSEVCPTLGIAYPTLSPCPSRTRAS